MYLLIIHVPAYVKSDEVYVTTDWKRSLLLLKESLQGQFGEVIVLCPSMPFQNSDQILETLTPEDGIRVIPSVVKPKRALEYWTSSRNQWKKDIRYWVAKAEVVHAGMDELLKPMMFEGFCEAVKQNKTTVFVLDTDSIIQLKELAKSSIKESVKNRLISFYLERAIRWAVSKASLSLLKGKQLMTRYAPYARNPKEFHDTSYSLSDVISRDELENKITRFCERTNFKLVYAGRFEPRKGIAKSLDLVAEALKGNPGISFDIIGGGPERTELEELVKKLNISENVRFIGKIPYGRDFIQKLAEYDALLFTPLAEDTPRMIFDCFAGGLPLISTDIPYCREVIQSSGAGVLIKTSNDLLRIVQDRESVVQMMHSARDEALKQTSNYWYAKRAEWTIEAYQQHVSRERVGH